MEDPRMSTIAMRTEERDVTAPADDLTADQPEVSVVIPCLDEAETLGVCISKALSGFQEHGINGEVVVADNGSTDGSQAIAEEAGARVVPVAAKGYGNALMGGIAAARGRYIVMGDADDSYDFRETHRFVDKLRQGYDLVQGCRLPSGGGTVKPGAMPFLHRWLGNPLFSFMVRVMFGSKLHDVYCGLRGFTREHYRRLDLRCTGMEFAIEMVVKSSVFGCKMTEVPITLHPDGRTLHPPHLRTFRDGWRTLRFLLLYSPRWLFLIPGLLLVLLGAVGYALALPGVTVLGAHLDVSTLLVASLAILLGHQSVLFALFTKRYAASVGFLPEDARVERFFKIFTLERGLQLGLLSFLAGVALLAAAAWQWYAVRFGDLAYPVTLRWVIPGVTLTALGFQTVLASFFVSILEIRRK
jgi:glycosyltransferase involved in cell wall biosynthesis